jgi:hypothetical protein
MTCDADLLIYEAILLNEYYIHLIRCVFIWLLSQIIYLIFHYSYDIFACKVSIRKHEDERPLRIHGSRLDINIKAHL